MTVKTFETIKKKFQPVLDNLPDRPGVYQMYRGSVPLYIGKAKNLQKRVRSYFRPHPDTEKIWQLISSIDRLEWIVTDTELEALVLEANLIKGPFSFFWTKAYRFFFFLNCPSRRLRAQGAALFQWDFSLPIKTLGLSAGPFFPIRWK